MVTHWVHTPEIVGSIPTPAIAVPTGPADVVSDHQRDDQWMFLSEGM